MRRGEDLEVKGLVRTKWVWVLGRKRLWNWVVKGDLGVLKG